MFLSNWGILPPLLVCWEFYHLLVLDFVKVPFSASVNMIIRLFFFILLMWKNILIFFFNAEPYLHQFSSVQSFSRVRLFVTPWITACQASLSITNSQSSPRLTSIESMMPSRHLILSCPLLLPPPIPPSIRVFSNESPRINCTWSWYVILFPHCWIWLTSILLNNFVFIVLVCGFLFL